MTDDQFERIKKGLNFHSEGGVYNLCTLTETTLRTIIEDAVKFYEKQQKIDAEQIRALQKQNGELTDKVKELEEELTLTNNECKDMREELKQRIRENQKLCEQVEKMKSDVLSLIKDRMNDDIDQNIIERLAEKWEIK